MKFPKLLLLCCALLSGWVSAQNVSMITMNWPPFYGSELEENGFITAIANAAFKASGYEANLTISTWPDSLEQVKTGNKDVLLGAYFSEERNQIYHYSLPMFSAQTGLVKLPSFEQNFYTSYEMLDGYHLGKLEGAVLGESFDQYSFQHLELFLGVLPALEALKAGNIDLYADNLAVARHFAPEAGIDPADLTLLQPPIDKKDLYLLISKEIPNALEIRDAFNRGLVSIQADGTYEKILARFDQM